MAEVDFDIEGLNSEETSNVEIFLQSLDAPKNIDDPDYIFEVTKSTKSALTVFGYYQPVINVVTTITEDQDQSLTLTVQPGQKTRIVESDIKLLGKGKDELYFKKVVSAFNLNIGDVLNHSHYEGAKSALKAVARRYGYFDAKFSKALVEVTSSKNSANVYLWFDTGPRYKFGDFIFESDLEAKENIVSLRPFNVGDDFDTKILSTLNADLSETGYFKSITILPDFSNKDGLQVPLNVIATMQPEDSFSAGLGYSTDEGIRGKFRWSRPWVNDAGHSIEGNVVASIPKQEASFTYKVPLEDPLYNYLSYQTGYKMVNQNDTDTTQFVTGLNRHWRFSNQWERTIFIRYEHEQGLQGQEDFSTSLIIPGFTFSRTRSTGGVNATWGDKLLASFEISNEWWLSSDDLIKVYGQAKILRTYSGHQFIASSELGVIQTDSIYNVPSSMRFFAGGDQSIRGFDYESIAPEDDDGYLLGGKYLTVASFEYRYPITENWKLGLFYDVGTATDDFSEELSSSVGSGIIWASPVGPIRLYFAKPITNIINDYAIHFMIGPEL